MSKKLSAVVALLLVFVVLFGVSGIAYSYPKYVTPEVPTIYLFGQGQRLTEVAGSNDYDNAIYPPQVDSDYVTKTVASLLPVLSKCIVTDEWQPYSDAIYDAVAPLFARIKCNDDGEVTDGSGSCWQNVGTAKRTVYSLGRIEGTGLNCYHMSYDWRLNTYELAEELRYLVDYVLTKNKVQRVNIVCRCLAANIVLSYIDMYGGDTLNKVIMYSGGYDGMEMFGALFSGKMSLNADNIETFCNGYLQSEDYADDTVFELLRAIVSLTNKMATLKTSTYWINKCYEEIRESLFPRLIMDTVGNMPSFWTYVGTQYYEDAKSFLFSTPELQTRYAKLIEKIDRYYNNITNHADELITKAQDDGATVYILAKYGYALVPLRDEFAEINSDTFVSLTNSSLGATVTSLFDTFSDEYLDAAQLNGTNLFIAPDNQVDASTCLLPTRTWFLKNITHRTMPDCVNPLIQFIIMEDNVDVFTSDEFPQYLVLNDEMTQMSPMVKENANTQDKAKMSFFQSLRLLFQSLLALLKQFFNVR